MTVQAHAEGPTLIDGPYAWFRLAICILLSTVGSVGMWSVVVVLPSVQAEFGVDRAAASLPYTMTMVGFAAGNLLIGRWVDRHGVLLPLLGSTVALGAGFMMAALAPSLWFFSAVQGALIGFGTAGTFGPLIADISHWFQRRRGIAVAATACGNYMAGALWPNIVQWGVETEGWRTTYTGVGVAVIVAMVPLAFLLRQRLPAEELAMTPVNVSRARPVQSIDISPRGLQIMLAIAGVGCCMAMAMPQVHIVAYCADLGFGVARGAEMLSLMLFGGIFSRLASGFLADRIGGVKTLLIGSVLQCLALFFYLPFDGLTSLYVVSLIFGLSQGGIVPSYAIIVREYLPAKEAGQRMGVVIMATIFGMAFGGWMSGWIYDLTGSYQAAFLNGIAWNLLNIGIMVTLLLRTGRGQLATA
ncbi:MFS transporter [Stappia sp. F7233]|uniref:MFS transporter n=1 Tax=Stappia albiluteola TaxID=2758565 RepID=A0A839AJ58_9HYPH|nr:MFS transporter [Stappia albiluteola]MBA5779068.1 MFS transporter [Stappia albiluteola]